MLLLQVGQGTASVRQPSDLSSGLPRAILNPHDRPCAFVCILHGTQRAIHVSELWVLDWYLLTFEPSYRIPCIINVRDLLLAAQSDRARDFCMLLGCHQRVNEHASFLCDMANQT